MHLVCFFFLLQLAILNRLFHLLYSNFHSCENQKEELFTAIISLPSIHV